jgi:nuclear pore complex protein Nup133
MSRFSEAISSEDDSLQHLLLLVAFSNKRRHQHSLVEVVLYRDVLKVGTVRPLSAYLDPVKTTAAAAAAERPRLFLPRPALVAFVVFDRAVVVASMALPPDSPDSQLQADSQMLPASFEDVIDFRDEDTLQIVGSGTEEPFGNGQGAEEPRSHRHKTKNPTAVVMVRGFGIVRVAVTDIDRFGSEKPPQVTAKSKLEQAVFFGIKDGNPLVFEGRRELQFSNKDIGDAAIQLSHEIVSSKTPFIANLPASLESNMRTRASYLDKLMSHLNAINVDLSRRARWTLLWNAEKMAVATWIWQQHEQFLVERTKDDKKSIVSEIATYVNEQQKTEPNPDVGEVDPVRHWFINDIWRLDIFMAWGYQVIKYFYQESLSDDAGLTRLLHEAVTILDGGLREALSYRESHAVIYGVEQSRDSEVLPEPWTATLYITNNLKRLVEFCYPWLDNYYVQHPDDTTVDRKLLESIRQHLPSLTSRYFIALQEYSLWADSSRDPQAQEFGRLCAQNYKTDAYDKILKLKDYKLWDEAIQLAVEHQSFNAL